MGQEDSYEMGERSELFYAVMDLPVKYRTVIHLFYYEGYTVKEIAELPLRQEMISLQAPEM